MPDAESLDLPYVVLASADWASSADQASSSYSSCFAGRASANESACADRASADCAIADYACCAIFFDDDLACTAMY